MLNYTTVVNVEIKHMSEFITPRKRKSEVTFEEFSVKKSVVEPIKPLSTSKKIIRRLSTRLKIFTPNKIIKSRYQIDEDIFSEERENDEKKLNDPISVPEPNLCSSMTYFAAQHLKKNGLTNDRVSNSSDTSRQSSSTTQHLRIGIDLFNRDVKCGVEYMQKNGVIDSDEELAELFIKKKGFSKMKLFEFLTAKENRSIHRHFCDHLDLKFKTIPELLGEYLKYSFISGEYGTMLDIVDVLSHAYMNQHKEGSVMGLTVDQVITISQYLITFNANEQKEKINNRISRDRFIEYLQSSLTENNKISRQLASCLYLEICEAPLTTVADERARNLDKVLRMLTDVPKDLSLLQHHRYIICHVDLCKVVLPISCADRPTIHDRTLFLFNDMLLVTKKNWSYDHRSFRVKQIVSLSRLRCAWVTVSASYVNPSSVTMRLLQISDVDSSDIVLNLHSKLAEDLTSFHANVEHSIGIHRALIDFHRDYESRSRDCR